MGRPRAFDETAVIAAAAAVFADHGYEATSVDDLLVATGLHRGSLYQAFASKRGLFLAVLRAHLAGSVWCADDPACDQRFDLVLVALLELAPRDDGARALVAEALSRDGPPGGAAAALGDRLLRRARITEHPTERGPVQP